MYIEVNLMPGSHAPFLWFNLVWGLQALFEEDSNFDPEIRPVPTGSYLSPVRRRELCCRGGAVEFVVALLLCMLFRMLSY